MSDNEFSATQEVISGALCAGGIGANLVLGLLNQPEDASTLQLKDIDDFINYDVAI